MLRYGERKNSCNSAAAYMEIILIVVRCCGRVSQGGGGGDGLKVEMLRGLPEYRTGQSSLFDTIALLISQQQ